MAKGITELIFGEPTRVQLGKILLPTVGIIEFDCSLSETHSAEAEVTDHPVENGSVMSDHIRALPETVEINGMVTNTPLVYLASLLAKSPVQPSTIPTFDRVNAAYLKLNELKNSGTLIDVVTSLRGYTDMAITSIVIVRDATTGNVLNCTVSLREVVTATSLAIGSPIPNDVANKAAAHKAKLAKDAATAKQAETAQQARSGLSSFTGLG